MFFCDVTLTRTGQTGRMCRTSQRPLSTTTSPNQMWRYCFKKLLWYRMNRKSEPRLSLLLLCERYKGPRMSERVKISVSVSVWEEHQVCPIPGFLPTSREESTVGDSTGDDRINIAMKTPAEERGLLQGGGQRRLHLFVSVHVSTSRDSPLITTVQWIRTTLQPETKSAS